MMKPHAMDQKRFIELLDAYGAAFQRWPAAYRQAGALFLKNSDAAQRAYAEATQLDALLDAIPALEPSPGIRARILELPVRFPIAADSVASSWWPFRRTWQPVLLLSAAAAFGLWVGPQAFPDNSLVSEKTVMPPTTEDWDSLSEIAFATPLDSEEWP